MINDMRLNKGLPALGFLNQILYKTMSVKDAIIDITSGNNSTCGYAAFSAVEGWDPVTGLGILNFRILRDLWTQESFEFSIDKLEFMRLGRKYGRKYRKDEEYNR